MPTKKYTEADVARAGRKRLSITVEPPPEQRRFVTNLDMPGGESPDETSAAQLLAEARHSLNRANNLASWRDNSDANIDADFAAADAMPEDQPSVFDSAATKLARLGKRIVRPIPAAAEKAAMVGAFLAPPVAIPSQAIIAAASGKRLLSGETEGGLDTGLNVLGLVGGGAASLKGLRSLIGAKQAATAATSARNAAAGSAAQDRYLARQLDETGYAPEAVEKIVGLAPDAPRSIVTGVKPISTQGVDISGLMDEAWPGRYVQPSAKPSVQGLMDALDSRVSGLAPQGGSTGSTGLVGNETDQIADLFKRGLRRQSGRRGSIRDEGIR